jgi:hypothetical protein
MRHCNKCGIDYLEDMQYWVDPPKPEPQIWTSPPPPAPEPVVPIYTVGQPVIYKTMSALGTMTVKECRFKDGKLEYSVEDMHKNGYIVREDDLTPSGTFDVNAVVPKHSSGTLVVPKTLDTDLGKLIGDSKVTWSFSKFCISGLVTKYSPRCECHRCRKKRGEQPDEALAERVSKDATRKFNEALKTSVLSDVVPNPEERKDGEASGPGWLIVLGRCNCPNVDSTLKKCDVIGNPTGECIEALCKIKLRKEPLGRICKDCAVERCEDCITEYRMFRDRQDNKFADTVKAIEGMHQKFMNQPTYRERKTIEVHDDRERVKDRFELMPELNPCDNCTHRLGHTDKEFPCSKCQQNAKAR